MSITIYQKNLLSTSLNDKILKQLWIFRQPDIIYQLILGYIAYIKSLKEK